MDDEKRRRLAERAQHLIHIREHSSWKAALKPILEERIRSDTLRFISSPEVEQQRLDYGRGFLAGLNYVLRVVEGGNKELERTLAAAGELSGKTVE